MDLFMATINGIRRAAISNKNLVDYKQWGLVARGMVWYNNFGSDLFAVNVREKLINMTLIPILF
jgi:hypothetical protein